MYYWTWKWYIYIRWRIWKKCDLVQFKIDKNKKEIKKISEIRNAHNEYIPDWIQLKNGNIVLGGGDGKIKIWT